MIVLSFQTRIKKVMQSDEEIGRMVASVPVAIGRAMEHFAEVFQDFLFRTLLFTLYLHYISTCPACFIVSLFIARVGKS